MNDEEGKGRILPDEEGGTRAGTDEEGNIWPVPTRLYEKYNVRIMFVHLVATYYMSQKSLIWGVFGTTTLSKLSKNAIEKIY